MKGEFKSCGLCNLQDVYACQVAVCISCKKRYRMGKLNTCKACGGTLVCEHVGHRVTAAGAIRSTGIIVAHIAPCTTICPRCGKSVDAHKISAHYRQVKCREKHTEQRCRKLGMREVSAHVAALLALAGYTRGPDGMMSCQRPQVIDVPAIGTRQVGKTFVIADAIPAAVICHAFGTFMPGTDKDKDGVLIDDAPDPIMLEAREALVAFLRDHVRPRTSAGCAAEALLDLTEGGELPVHHAMTLWTLIRETVGCSRCQAEARRVADASPGGIPESDDSDEEV